MSTIQSSCDGDGLRAAVRVGTARCSTVRSITTMRQGNARTARPIHSRRPARGGTAVSSTIVWEVVIRVLFRPRRVCRPEQARDSVSVTRQRHGISDPIALAALIDMTCILQVNRVYSILTTKSSTYFLLISHLPLDRSNGQAHPRSRFAMKQKHHRRSDCPINFALETFGDSWSLLIVRDIVYFGKKTYREFLESDEGIATNILASRLAQLEQKGLLLKNPHERDKRKDLYLLTEKGLDLIPILLELASWSAQHDPQTAAPQAWIARVNADKATLKRCIRETVQRGGSIFVGPDSVVRTLAGEENSGTQKFQNIPGMI